MKDLNFPIIFPIGEKMEVNQERLIKEIMEPITPETEAAIKKDKAIKKLANDLSVYQKKASDYITAVWESKNQEIFIKNQKKFQETMLEVSYCTMEMEILKGKHIEAAQKKNFPLLLKKYSIEDIVYTLKIAIAKYAGKEYTETRIAVESLQQQEDKKNDTAIITIAKSIKPEAMTERFFSDTFDFYVGIIPYLEYFKNNDTEIFKALTDWTGSLIQKLLSFIPEDIKEAAGKWCEENGEKAAAGIKKHKSLATGIEKRANTIREILKPELLYEIMGYSPVIENIELAIGHASNPGDLIAVQKKINRNIKIGGLLDNETGDLITLQTQGKEGNETIVQFDEVQKVIKNNTAAAKFLPFIMTRINQQAYYPESGLRIETVSFPVEDIQRYFGCNSRRAAITMFNAATEALTSIKVRARRQINRKKKLETGQALAVLFTYRGVSNGICSVDLNGRIDWRALSDFFMIIPKYAYSKNISLRTFNLIMCICSRARQSPESINKKGEFNIRNRVLQKWLNLPMEKKTKNPGRDIVEKIEKAMEELEEADKGEMFMLEHGGPDETAGITEFMNNGYIRVKIQPSVIDWYKDVAKKREEQAKKAEKGKQRAINNNIEKRIVREVTEAIQGLKKTETDPKNVIG